MARGRRLRVVSAHSSSTMPFAVAHAKRGASPPAARRGRRCRPTVVDAGLAVLGERVRRHQFSFGPHFSSVDQHDLHPRSLEEVEPPRPFKVPALQCGARALAVQKEEALRAPRPATSAATLPAPTRSSQSCPPSPPAAAGHGGGGGRRQRRRVGLLVLVQFVRRRLQERSESAECGLLEE